jgi:hypothetical protein
VQFELLELAVVLMVAGHRPLQAGAGVLIVLAGIPVQRWLATRTVAIGEGRR